MSETRWSNLEIAPALTAAGLEDALLLGDGPGTDEFRDFIRWQYRALYEAEGLGHLVPSKEPE